MWMHAAGHRELLKSYLTLCCCFAVLLSPLQSDLTWPEADEESHRGLDWVLGKGSSPRGLKQSHMYQAVPLTACYIPFGAPVSWKERIVCVPAPFALVLAKTEGSPGHGFC